MWIIICNFIRLNVINLCFDGTGETSVKRLLFQVTMLNIQDVHKEPVVVRLNEASRL
jgi:hypothetical protein